MKRLILLTATLLLAAPAAAHAVQPVLTINGSGDYVLTGILDGTDDITVSLSGANLVFKAAGAMLQSPGAPCGPSAETVTCTPAHSYDGVHLTGGGGADTLTVSGDLANHDVTLDGGDDADVLTGGGEQDRFVPGSGGDTISGGTSATAADPLAASPGTDSKTDILDLEAATTKVTISFDGVANDGPAGDNDNVLGGIEDIETGTGDDVIDLGGQAGDHEIYTGEGNDQVIGSNGNDYINAGDGDDTVAGGPGIDVLNGDDDNGSGGPPGKDRLDGGDGDDLINGMAADDIEIGGPGDDSFSRNLFVSALYSEYPMPDYGNDDVSGGDGLDSIAVVRFQDDRYGAPTAPGSGSGGVSVVRSTRLATPPISQPVNVSLDDVANDGRAGEADNIHSDVENVTTGDSDDVVTGSAAANMIATGFGKDTVDPGAGADDVNTGEGDDTLLLKDLTGDRASCGAGTDTVTADATLDVLFGCETIARVALPVPVVPTPPDTTKPTGKITGLGSTVKKKTFTKSGLKLTVTTSEPAKVAAELFATLSTGKKFGFAASVNDLQIGSSSLKLGSGARKLTLKPSAKWKARTKNRRLRLTVKLTITDAAGNVSTVTKKVRVK